MGTVRNMTGDPWFMALTGMAVVALSLAGVGYSLRAGMAQQRYHEAKYGCPEASTDRLLELCQKAYAGYPHNYYFSILAAEQAYSAADREPAGKRSRRLEQAVLWCDRGLRQNWYKSQLRRLKTRLLWEESPSAAIRFWSAYTDWQFWEPYNHAVLAGMHARVGDFAKADAALRCIAGMPEEAEARRVVDTQRQEWTSILEGAR